MTIRTGVKLACTGLIALGVAILATPVGSALDKLDDPGSGDSVPSPEVVPDPLGEPSTPSPVLTAEQEEQARELIVSDDATQKLLADLDYALDVGPWGGEDAAGRLRPVTGAIVRVRLGQPTDFGMQAWPEARLTPDPSKSYTAETIHFAAQEATELIVLVDLGAERVVSIRPQGADLKIQPGADLKAAASAASADYAEER